MADNEGEILPRIVMSDVVRWLVAHVDTDRTECRAILRWLEAEYKRGPEDVAEMIVVSGIEMLPYPGEPGAVLRDLLGPALREADPLRVAAREAGLADPTSGRFRRSIRAHFRASR